MENLLKETLKILEGNGKTPADVLWIQTSGSGPWERRGRHSIYFSWAAFTAVADREYDNGYGGAEVEESLKVVGGDWWLERGEYDGSEWWEFKTRPVRPEVCGVPADEDIFTTQR